MLDIGLIGPGPDWEARYRPVLQKLRQRIRVRSVYSPVTILADQAAADLECDVAPGLLALMQRPDIRAVLLLDSGWTADVPVQFACRHGKPVYLASRLLEESGCRDRMRSLAAGSDLTLMPDFGHRYTPATGRLKELIASRLGRPQRILISAGSHEVNGSGGLSISAMGRHALVDLIDWCRHLIGTTPTGIRAPRHVALTGNPPQGIPPCVQLEFKRFVSGGEPPVAEIRLGHAIAPLPTPNGEATGQYELRCEVDCARGRAVLDGPNQIRWEQNGETHEECLSADRSDVEVMLDHFCRRVVGGLIPIPTLDDVFSAIRLAEAALHSHSCGALISLTEN